MANLNLSEFTEKLFVADADHTFIWDTAASISKRVSRNSWLSGTNSNCRLGLAEAASPVAQTLSVQSVIAGTTNTAGAAFTIDGSQGTGTGAGGALIFRTAAAGSSGTAQNALATAMLITADKRVVPTGLTIDGSGLFEIFNDLATAQGRTFPARSASIGRLGICYRADAQIAWSPGNGSTVDGGNMGTADTILLRDGAGQLALRNGAAAQTFRVYGAYPDTGINYARLALSCDTSGNATISTQALGTYTAGVLAFSPGNSEKMRITAAGNVGIGTTAPNALLDVYGAENPRARFTVTNTTSGNFSAGLDFYTSTGEIGNFLTTASSYTTVGEFVANSLVFQHWGTGKMIFTTRGVAPIQFQINGFDSSSVALKIDTNKNVGIGTTSPTSKLHVVGDAVLTGDLLGTNYTIGVPTILTQSNISITNNHSGVADSAIVITPKGTGGVIFGPKPDGTTTGGNARGIYSVDLQTAAKTGPAQVASGAYSALVGGQANRASGAHSFCGGGNSNTPSGTFSVTCGGQSNIASGGQSFIGGGVGNTASSTNAFIAGGIQGLADRFSISAHSSGQFATTGDAQTTKAVFRNKTTTNSAVELFLDGASTRYAVTSGKIISMLINITGTKSDGSAVAHYVRQYSIKNIGGTTSEVYAAVTVGTDNAAGTSIALSADNTNDSLKIEVTGVASETWRWVASVDAVEVGHGV